MNFKDGFFAIASRSVSHKFFKIKTLATGADYKVCCYYYLANMLEF